MKTHKKWMTIIGIVTIILSIISVVYLLKKKKTTPEVITVDKNSFFIREINGNKIDNRQQNKIIYKESMHGGKGFFVGQFRFELTLSSKNIVILFMDNALGEPTYPNNTDLYIVYKDHKCQLKVVRNGVLTCILKEYKLGDDLKIMGKFINKPLSAIRKIKEYKNE